HVFPPAELDRMEVDWSRFEESLARPLPGYACFVAELDGRVLGWALVGPSGEPKRFGEVHGLYVDPEVWSTGVGRALIARGEEELALVYREAVLWVLDDKPRARRFYERAG